ncbi:MAG: uroporphyrinogen decarboxylase family protein [bacterium]
MREMTKRERVERTLNLQETDRVPVYDLLYNDSVIEYFTGKAPTPGEEGLKITCEAISKMLDMTRSVTGPSEPRIYIREDGFVIRQERWTSWIEEKPFKDEEGARKWLLESIDRLKKTDIEEIAKGYMSYFNKILSHVGDTVVLHAQTGTGLDELRWALGIELFSYLSVDEPGLISEYLDAYTDLQVKFIHKIADRRLSPCALTYGDIAAKERLLHSPEWLRKEFFPRLKRLNDAWHEYGIKCLFHSDGYIMEVIPDLIETGIDGLNPIETVAGMDLKEVKRLYGNKLFIAGGIDVSQLLSNGTPEEVREVCKESIQIGYPGYFIGSTTELDNGAKLENVLAMLEVVWSTKF